MLPEILLDIVIDAILEKNIEIIFIYNLKLLDCDLYKK